MNAFNGWQQELTAVAAIVLVQCTITMALVCFAAWLLKRRAALRQSVLRGGLALVLTCPLITWTLRAHDIAFISLPVAAKQAEAASRLPAATPTVGGESALLDESEPVILPSLPQISRDFPSSTGSVAEDTPPTSRSSVDVPGDSVGVVGIVVAAWLLGVVAIVFGIFRSWQKLHQLLRAAESETGEAMRAAIADARQSLRLSTFPPVVNSRDVRSPVAAGVWRPRIVVPTGLSERLTPAELRMVLLHEAAHIMQRDHISLLVERLFLAVFWFHPLAHLLVRQLSRAHEEVCDNWVLRFHDSVSYGEALLRLTTLVLPRPLPVAGVGLLSARWKLEERISGLLDERRQTMVRTNSLAKVSISLLLGLAVLAIGVTKLPADQDEVTPSSSSPAEAKAASTAATASDATSPASTSPAGESVADSATLNDPRVVAIVNGESITVRDLPRHLLQKTDKSSIDNLVNKKILEQACRKHNITVTEEHLDEQVARTAKKFGLSVNQLYGEIRQRGMTPDVYRRDVVRPLAQLRQLSDVDNAGEYFRKLKAAAEVLTNERSIGQLAQATDPATPDTATSETPTPDIATPDTATETPAGRIAFVNVARVFQETPSFKQRTEALKRSLQEKQGAFRELVVEVQALEKAAQALSAKSADEKVVAELKALIEKKKLAHQQAMRDAKQGAVERESEIYHSVYQAIHQEIRAYAKENEIALVLRDPGPKESKSVFESIDPTQTNPKDSRAVLQQVNQYLLYVDGVDIGKKVDITDAIIARLKQRATAR